MRRDNLYLQHILDEITFLHLVGRDLTYDRPARGSTCEGVAHVYSAVWHPCMCLSLSVGFDLFFTLLTAFAHHKLIRLPCRRRVVRCSQGNFPFSGRL